jgi:photosystem II stability/assembly factor-like uncharacterized protein
VKSPTDDTEAGRAGVDYGPDAEDPPGKAYLREQEFLQQRGLEADVRELPLDDDGRAAAVAERGEAVSPYMRGMREKMALLEEHPPDPAAIWGALGPAGIPNGQTYGSGPGATATMSGRVAAIAVDPLDADHLLIGAASGGVWQTRDGGVSWTPQTDEQPTLSIGALAFDPSDATTVYAGTGEGNSEYARLGQGILVSSDGGDSWNVIAADLFTSFGFYRLIVDPRDSERLIAATTGGAVESSDGGGTWSLLHRGMTWDASLAFHGNEPELLLAAPDGVFAARGGGPPARVNVPGLPATLDRRSERMAVAHVPSDPGQAFVFAASGGRARLWHRAALDQPYVEVQLPFMQVPPNVDDVFDVKQAWYDWHLSIPPWADDTVYLGLIELARGVRIGGDWEWTDISSRSDGGDSIHPDQHTMAFDAQPQILYAGNDGGIFRSRDAGDSWESLNPGLETTEVEYLTQRPDEALWLMAGLQDNGTIRRDAELAWSQVALGDGGDCGTNLDHPDICFHSYFGMSLERSPQRGNPDSWLRLRPPRGGDALFYPPVEVNGSVVVKAGDVAAVSSNGGDDWSAIALPPRPDGQSNVASALAIPTHDRVLIGMIRGDVFRIERDNGNWGQPTALSTPRDGWISDLVVHPEGGQRYWATFSNPGAVFRSDDEGANWTDVTANLPTIPVNAIVGDPADPDRVWVACDVGVFETRDAGGSWAVYGTGLPNALAADLLFYEPDRLLRVGTRSRGVWETVVT